jgi:uncharacterized Fe-S center protein
MKNGLLVLLACGVILAVFTCGCTQNSNERAVQAQQERSIELPASTPAITISSSVTASNNTPSKVYMTKNITPEGLMAVYKALGREATGNVAIKVHMGERGNTNYISPDLVRDLVLSVNGTFVDSNTYYPGSRSSTAAHLETAKEHGFTYAPVDVLDADGEISLPINGGIQQTEAIIGSHYKNYDFIISIAHFKGHGIAGFGGTFKNLAIGMASVRGKGIVHGGQIFGTPQEVFLENVAEYTKAVADDKGDRILYINVLNNLSVSCDCDAHAPAPEMADIGILSSLDPVALDKASVDQIYASPDPGKQHLIQQIESRNGTLVLNDAERLGMGSQNYELVMVDG